MRRGSRMSHVSQSDWSDWLPVILGFVIALVTACGFAVARG